MNFKIKRNKWRSGLGSKNRTGKGDTRLLNLQGFMTILGQCFLQMGVSEDILLDSTDPDQVFTDLKNTNVFVDVHEDYFDKHLDVIVNSKFSGKVIKVNDCKSSPKKKEKKLKKLFKKHGIDIKFTGKF